MPLSGCLPFLVLLYCANSAFAHRTLLARVSSQNPTVEANSTLLKALLLAGKDKDPCLKKNTIQARAECIAPLLETYYGRYFTMSCPGFSLILAHNKCSGCPWSRIDPEALPEIGDVEFPLQPKDKFFSNYTKECYIARRGRYFMYRKVVFYAIGFTGLVVTIALSAISLLGAFSGFDKDHVKPVNLFGRELSERKYLLCLWILFYFILFYFAFANKYYKYCESLSSYFSEYRARVLAYGTTLAISLYRCLQLSHQGPSSWSVVIRRCSCHSYDGKHKWKLIGLVWLIRVMILVVFVTLLVDHIELNGVASPQAWCSSGQRDFWNGLLQYSKLVLEFFAVRTYAANGRTCKRLIVRRYISLAVIMLLSWIVSFLCLFTGLYKPRSHSTLFPGILDQEMAGNFVQLVHVNVISILGFLEFLRPRQVHVEEKIPAADPLVASSHTDCRRHNPVFEERTSSVFE